jgi:hypothetical protein
MRCAVRPEISSPRAQGVRGELGGIAGDGETLDDGQGGEVVEKEHVRLRDMGPHATIGGGDDLGCRAEIDLAGAPRLERELADGADDVMGAADDVRPALLVRAHGRPGGLVGLLGELRRVRDHLEDRALPGGRGDDARLDRVLADRVEGHAPAVDPPAVHVDALELRRDPRLEDLRVEGLGDALSVVEDDERPQVALAAGGHEDAPGTGIASVPEHLDDGVLDATDVMLGLAPLGLADAKLHEAVAELLLDAKGAVAGH